MTAVPVVSTPLRRIDVTFKPRAGVPLAEQSALGQVEVHGHGDEHGDGPPVEVRADDVAAVIEMLRRYYHERWFA